MFASGFSGNEPKIRDDQAQLSSAEAKHMHRAEAYLEAYLRLPCNHCRLDESCDG
jgi:hypothetical protein